MNDIIITSYYKYVLQTLITMSKKFFFFLERKHIHRNMTYFYDSRLAWHYPLNSSFSYMYCLTTLKIKINFFFVFFKANRSLWIIFLLNLKKYYIWVPNIFKKIVIHTYKATFWLTPFPHQMLATFWNWRDFFILWIHDTVIAKKLIFFTTG